ncbi:MAG: zf-HC2 domain-containing protein [Spirochaetes bacterium]|nr:zf-HC2 domain-containing protein [Spirochaetota bacterium]
MRCTKVRRLLFDYIDGVLDGTASEKVRSHLERCEKCALELESYRAYRENIALLRDVHAPEGFLAGVKNRILSVKDRDVAKRRIRPFSSYKLPLELAGALAVVLIAVVIFRHIEPTRKQSVPPVAPETKTEEEYAPEEAKDKTTGELREEKVPAAETIEEKTVESETPTADRRVPLKPLSEDFSADISSGALKGDVTDEREAGIDDLSRKKEPPAEADMEALKKAPQAAEYGDRLLVSAPPETAVEITLTLFVPRPSEEVGEKTAAKKELGVQQTVTPDANETESRLRTEDVTLGLDAFENRVRSLSEKLGGTIVSIEYGTERDNPRWISVRIPAERYEDLLEALSTLGVMETPLPKAPEETPVLLVRITIAE